MQPPQQYQGQAQQTSQYQSTTAGTLQYDVVSMGQGCGNSTFEAGKIKEILNQQAQQGKELVHMYEDMQNGTCNAKSMLIMVFKYR